MAHQFPIRSRRQWTSAPACAGRLVARGCSVLVALLVVVALVACTSTMPPLLNAGQPATDMPSTAEPTPSLEAVAVAVPVSATPCALPTIVPPSLPAKIPGYTELDPATNLHMTGTVQQIDLASYRLKVSGKVNRPLSLSYDDLRCMPKVQRHCTLVCPGFFTDEATWAGVPLAYVLGLAGVQDGAQTVKLVSADGYSPAITLQEALTENNFLAYEWESEPLPILHGFPLRAVLPDHPGGLWTKWLIEIRVE
jgi:DMSO/TMAO reductase YedYZ molybdopterin-dependent catalytic subunit